MNEKEYNFIHDLTNKLTALDGKLRKVKKCESIVDIMCEIEKINVYNTESLSLLTEYKKYLEQKENS